MIKRLFLCQLLAGASVLAFPGLSLAGDTPESIVSEGQVFGELRYRYEYVDQDGPAPVTDEARASTIRANLGVKTGEYKHFQALLEAQIVANVGADDFNDTVNRQTQFPVVADPDNEDINQAWLSWNGLTGTEIKIGRQGINLDNQRYIGTVDWRQNDQTFDSVVFTYSGLEKANLTYGYIANVNRVFGDKHPLGDLDSTSHILNGSYGFAEWLKVTGYGYWLEFDRLQARSSQTFGLRLTGKKPIGKNWSVSYEAELARQSDRGNNPTNYDESYYHIAPSVSGHGLTLTAGYEVLGGDGTHAFQTPLATLHKFNGWADKFLDTPAAGLEDAYIGASYKVSGLHKAVDGTTLTAAYHDFDGEEQGDFGSEFDASIGRSFELPKPLPAEKLNLLIKYADYNADDAPYTDTQKVWLQVGVTF